MILRILLIVFIFLLAGCTPEDGWCSIEKHSGNEDFNCSQMDKNFSCTGQSILESFTDSAFVYRKTEVTDDSGLETVMDKPDYIPETITFKSMDSCSLAPKAGGIDCTSWTEFTFTTEENITVTASSKSGDNTTSSCNPKFIEADLGKKNLSGIKSDSYLYLNDTSIKNGVEIKVRHYYLYVD